MPECLLGFQDLLTLPDLQVMYWQGIVIMIRDIVVADADVVYVVVDPLLLH